VFRAPSARCLECLQEGVQITFRGVLRATLIVFIMSSKKCSDDLLHDVHSAFKKVFRSLSVECSEHFLHNIFGGVQSTFKRVFRAQSTWQSVHNFLIKWTYSITVGSYLIVRCVHKYYYKIFINSIVSVYIFYIYFYLSYMLVITCVYTLL
jgi:hypothetical protein